MRIIILTLTVCFVLISCKNSKQTDPVSVETNKNSNPELAKSIERGKEIYSNFCTTCHMHNGKGVKNTFPPLANSDYLKNKREESIKAIKFGLSGEIKVNGEIYNTPMTRLGLSDKEVADVMNYITNSWGNQNNRLVTEKEVSKIKP